MEIALFIIGAYCLVCWFVGWSVVSSSHSSIIQPDEFFGFMIIVLAPIWLIALLFLAAVDVLYWTPKRKAEEARWRQPSTTVPRKSWFNKSWLRLPVLV